MSRIGVRIICGPCLSDHCWKCEGECPCEHPPLEEPVCTCGQVPCRRWRQLLGSCPGRDTSQLAAVPASQDPPSAKSEEQP